MADLATFAKLHGCNGSRQTVEMKLIFTIRRKHHGIERN